MITVKDQQTTGPLSGIRVLDFSTLLPGPYATMLLADMGAEVVRVESPLRVDLLREMAPRFDERSYAHLAINRNKKSFALDLKHPQARPIIQRLVTYFDVLIEQFRPGVMQRFGQDFESLRALNSRLIYCSLTGYGQTGPMKDKAGHDINYLALSGLASYSGKAETGPVLSATQIADIAGGSQHAVMAILAALIQRQSSGEGQYLDISMSDAAFSLNTLYGAAALATGKDPQLGGEMLNGGCYYDYYRTQDDRYLSVGGLEPQFAAVFFEVIGHAEWLDRATRETGQQQRLKDDIAKIILTKSLAEWLQLFEPLDVCVEPVLSVTEASLHPHLNARNMLCTVAIDSQHQVQQIASPLKFSGQSSCNKAGAKLGADSTQVLSDFGFNPGEIKSFIESGAVFQAGKTASENPAAADRQE